MNFFTNRKRNAYSAIIASGRIPAYCITLPIAKLAKEVTFAA
jgi:hypothetical protein